MLCSKSLKCATAAIEQRRLAISTSFGTFPLQISNRLMALKLNDLKSLLVVAGIACSTLWSGSAKADLSGYLTPWLDQSNEIGFNGQFFFQPAAVPTIAGYQTSLASPANIGLGVGVGASFNGQYESTYISNGFVHLGPYSVPTPGTYLVNWSAGVQYNEEIAVVGPNCYSLGAGCFNYFGTSYVSFLSIPEAETLSGSFYVAVDAAGNVSTVTPAVPEPSTWAMMLLGLAGLGIVTYRRPRALRVSFG